MKTCRAKKGFSLLEVLVAGAITAALMITAMWSAISSMRLGSHEESALVSMGKAQALFAQLERDIRDARPKCPKPLLLDEESLKAIDFPGNPIAFAELPKPILQLVSIEPGGDDQSHSGEYHKKWTYTPHGWEHNRWPGKFRSADDDLPPYDEPDLERVASEYYPGYEETFSLICWPSESDVSRVYFAIYRGCDWVIYTQYIRSSETRGAGSIFRWTTGMRTGEQLIGSGLVLFSAVPSFEFAAHPGNKYVGMELVKSAVVINVAVAEPDSGNAIPERLVRLSRRVYPEWLQAAPQRVRWVGH